MSKKKTDWQKGVLKLAKSMELGCGKTRGAKGTYIARSYGHIVACALGAAFVNGSKPSEALDEISLTVLEKRFPVLLRFDGFRTKSLEAEIVNRNDVQNHRRRSIVAWLRRVAKLESPPYFWADVK